MQWLSSPRRLTLYLLALVCLLSCTKQHSSLSSVQISSEGWYEPIQLDALVREAGRPYNVAIAVRFDNRVDSTHLTLKYYWLWRKMPIDSGTFTLKLAEVDDRGQAKIFTPMMHEAETYLSNRYMFAHSGIYELQLQPQRTSPLLGVSDITLLLHPSTDEY